MFAAALVVSRRGSNGPDLAPGRFVAKATGSVEGELAGPASSAVAVYDPDTDALSLELVIGSFLPSGQDYKIETGLLLEAVGWTGRARSG